MDTLEQMLDVQDTITTPFDDFDLVIEPFDKGARLILDEVVGDQVLPAVQQLQKAIETGETALAHALPPEADAP